MTNLFDLSDDVAVVIGGTGGLGGAIAEGLAVSGAKVAIIGRNTERGEARVAAIKKDGGTSAFFPADALKREELRAAHEKIGHALGGAPTILVNAAGGNDPKATVTAEQKFEDIPTANWASVF